MSLKGQNWPKQPSKTLFKREKKGGWGGEEKREKYRERVMQFLTTSQREKKNPQFLQQYEDDN